MQVGELHALYIRETARIGRPAFRLGRTNVSAFKAFAAFCDRHGVDPLLWIRAKHEAVDWQFRISAKQLCSTKFIPKFREWGEDKQARAVGQERLCSSVVENRGDGELDLGVEALRASLLSDPLVCLGYKITKYDARSRWCPACPVEARCRARG